MSVTPRTDEALDELGEDQRSQVSYNGPTFIEFARQLEREIQLHRSYLYGCDKHNLWQGTGCIGCIENERDELKQQNKTLRRIGFLEGMIEGITMYATWRDGQQTVGCMDTPLKELLEPYRQELKKLS